MHRVSPLKRFKPTDSPAFCTKQVHWAATRPGMYRKGIRSLTMQAQQGSTDRLCSSYFQVTALLEMRLVEPR